MVNRIETTLAILHGKETHTLCPAVHLKRITAVFMYKQSTKVGCISMATIALNPPCQIIS
jgi:hypothetical protein